MLTRTQLLRWSLAALVLGAGTPGAFADAAADFERAIVQNDVGAVQRLLQAGVDPNTRNAKGVPGLYLALQQGALDVARVLMASRRINVNQANATDETPLMMAAFKGQLEIARQLIQIGAAIHKPGWTPLHYAATNGQLEVIQLLLDSGATVDARSPNNTTPLMMAASYGSPEAVKLLLQAGADPSLRNDRGLTALDFARRAERQNSGELIVEMLRRKRGKPGW